MAALRARIKRLWPRPKAAAAHPGPGTDAVLPPAGPRWRRWPLGLLAALLLVAGAMALGESLGWPFLAGPVERALSALLHRRVSLSAPAGADAGKAASAFSVRFFGSVRVRAPWLEIGAPPWSTAPYTLQAGDVTLGLRYGDLWRAYRDAPLHIDSLQAATLDARLERLADGRASWQLGQAPAPPPPPPPASAAAKPRLAMPAVGRLQITAGTLRLQDALLDIDAQARMSLRDGAPGATPELPAAAAAEPPAGFKLQATGRFRKLPLRLTLTAGGLPGRVLDDASVASKALTLEATVGQASLSFQGQALDAAQPGGFSGRFTLTGPSLAAVGNPVGVTLPTTGAFRAQGQVSKQGLLWQVLVADATVGSSRLSGTFSYDADRAVPLLSGKLLGTRLMLADLGPVVGTTPEAPSQRTSASPGRVLPKRPFDLPSMRAMDADVRIDIAEVDLNSRFLEPLRPLHAQLQMAGGVLRLTGIEARTGQGSLVGDVSLDGHGSQALWRADLRWDGVKLEQWLRYVRANGVPPYVSGTLRGRASVQGQGRSTADILASLKGDVRTDLRGGRVSNLAVEVAGIDIAESIGVLIKGDDTLAVQSAVADLRAEAGVLKPRVMVVAPKDFSPLTLRAPLRVGGSFRVPRVSIDKAPLARKFGATLLLALVNPFAALLPLIDPGNAAEAARAAAGCHGLKARLPQSVQTPARPAR